ncbi:MAG: glutathione peroxidase [Ferruginibacter sp.]|nr:glutathione peroxidase [Ferruginibacter sp.]
MKQSIHSFNVPGITGDTIHFANFKGKKILIVNTASKCGYTPQYTDLERLYESYKNNLVIVGFPANDFKQQEPGSNEEINAFCKKNYGVTFPMAAKISVIGENIHPIYAWLTSKEKNGVMDAEVKWNFNKFLLDEEGFLLMKFDSDINPLDPEITKRIK